MERKSDNRNREAGKSRRKQKKKSRGILRRLLLILMGIVLGINLYLANARNIAGNQLPMPFGMGAAVVLSGSMEPNLSKGDLIFVQRTEPLQLEDIIVYQSGSSLIVHRIVSMYGDTIVTQGDANNVPDEPISTSQIKGKVIGHIPWVGNVLNFLKIPVVSLAVLILAFALTELSFRRQKEEDGRDLEEVKEEIRRLKEELGKDREG